MSTRWWMCLLRLSHTVSALAVSSSTSSDGGHSRGKGACHGGKKHGAHVPAHAAGVLHRPRRVQPIQVGAVRQLAQLLPNVWQCLSNMETRYEKAMGVGDTGSTSNISGAFTSAASLLST
jgi:hypothetical protein